MRWRPTAPWARSPTPCAASSANTTNLPSNPDHEASTGWRDRLGAARADRGRRGALYRRGRLLPALSDRAPTLALALLRGSQTRAGDVGSIYRENLALEG